jgi:hypothetical protein
MSIVDLTANISQYKKELYNNCIRIPVCFSWKWGHPVFCGHILSLFLFFSIINLLYTCITEGASDVWIGLNDNKEQNFFEWINGEVTKYTNWNVNQPANTNSQNENCVMINKTVSDVIKLLFIYSLEWVYSIHLQLLMQSVPITTDVVSLNLDQGQVYNIMR